MEKLIKTKAGSRLIPADSKRKYGVPPIGDKFGDWEIVGGPYITFLSADNILWECKCKCGHIGYLEARFIIAGKTKGCRKCSGAKAYETKIKNNGI